MKILFLQDADSIPLSKKERILYFLLLIFFFAIYMPGITWLYNVLMWIFFAYSFFFNSLKDKWAILKNGKEIMLILIFFLLNLGSALLSANQKEGISFAGIRLSLLIIPVAIGTIYIKPILKERLIFAFAVATAFAAVGVLLWGIWQSIKYSDLSLLYNDNLSNIINLQSIYFAMLINLAIFSFVYLLTKKSALINTNAIIPVLFILFIVHFLLASRIAIIMLYGSIFVFAMVYIVSKKKILEGMTLILGLLLGSFLLVKFFPKTINRFKELGYTKFDFKSTAKESHYNVALTPDQWNGANIRIAVWECAWQVIKANMVFGTGLGDKGDELKKAYLKKEFTFGYTTNRNTHNNYIDVWMSLGLVGFIL
ncbi:MAG: O-antigen ligase family protein, partial [Ferruginibacter sp.]|nr:O-antigen ligase family protein [Ferruginibacter sp.]